MNPETVRRWFALVRDPSGRRSSVSWSSVDLTILDSAERDLLLALGGVDPARRSVAAENAAGQALSDFLSALAAAVAETRRQLGPRESSSSTGSPAESPMELAAGLLAGAAALGGRTADATASRAHRAGVAAAEAVVSGADLDATARAASGAFILTGALVEAVPELGGPDDVRLTATLAWLLEALVDATRPAMTGPDRAPCGATADHNSGLAFRAEVQFVVFGSPALVAAVVAEAEATPADVTVWSEGDRHVVHAHTRNAGRLISGTLAVATPFDLEVRLAGPARES